MTNELLEKIKARGVSLWVEHHCGHLNHWLLVIEETTLAEAQKDLEATECMACRRRGEPPYQ